MYDAEFLETQPVARCIECGELIYDDNDKTYVNEDGEHFCCLQCTLDHYGVHRIER